MIRASAGGSLEQFKKNVIFSFDVNYFILISESWGSPGTYVDKGKK